ncbi:hypothetical protein AMATHDRAFT_46151 [Amanita thiersii Skay4041]|uniref:Uncharacterized protein n=1 Tax=Amanita thiersii Skay4041 TaxID=703135 RepID=A0A2A9NXS1_9AGAR|nr:hypothetical protein AMATHDRAFT_46151 [Amanita thiersii Skay4041]
MTPFNTFSTVLSASLQRIQEGTQSHFDSDSHHINGAPEDDAQPTSSPSIHTPRTPISREGYGFRRSGMSTPAKQSDPDESSSQKTEDTLPDPNGLGWPGMFASTPPPSSASISCSFYSD